MDSENKQRISLYLDRDTVKKADKIMKEYGFKSRNEFYIAAVENFIADELLKESDSALSDKLARAVAELSENNAKAISKGLFRYAVQLEMVMRSHWRVEHVTVPIGAFSYAALHSFLKYASISANSCFTG